MRLQTGPTKALSGKIDEAGRQGKTLLRVSQGGGGWELGSRRRGHVYAYV